MNRSILTGLAVCFLTAALPAMASASEPNATGAPATGTPTTATQAAAAVAATAAADAAATNAAPAAVDATSTAAETDAAAPTDGADLAMWNAAPAKEPQPAAARPVAEHLGRLINVKRFASGIAARGIAMASSLTRDAMKFLGVPYVFGGTSAYGFDCSGYVQHVFAMIGVHLPRTADAQYAVAHRITGQPKPGDLVFFQTYAPGASHVGISLGGSRFVHASSHGVMVSSLHDSYWATRYLGAKRVFE